MDTISRSYQLGQHKVQLYRGLLLYDSSTYGKEKLPKSFEDMQRHGLKKTSWEERVYHGDLHDLYTSSFFRVENRWRLSLWEPNEHRKGQYRKDKERRLES
jgi:hypothetical protein